MVRDVQILIAPQTWSIFQGLGFNTIFVLPNSAFAIGDTEKTTFKIVVHRRFIGKQNGGGTNEAS
jgi:hypothetical protein